jgi:hypothetical protein
MRSFHAARGGASPGSRCTEHGTGDTVLDTALLTATTLLLGPLAAVGFAPPLGCSRVSVAHGTFAPRRGAAG